MSPGSPRKPIGVLLITFCFLSASLFRALALMSVAIKPGAMQLTLMPFGESSTAIALVMPSTADLEAVYAITFGMPYCEAIELILTMEPLPFANMCLTTSRDKAKTAVTFV